MKAGWMYFFHAFDQPWAGVFGFFLAWLTTSVIANLIAEIATLIVRVRHV